MPFDLPSRRILNFAGFAVCCGLMGFALFAQHVLLLDPCPLCVLQRVATIALGVVLLLAALMEMARPERRTRNRVAKSWRSFHALIARRSISNSTTVTR